MPERIDIEKIVDEEVEEEDMRRTLNSILDWERKQIEELNEPKQRRNREEAVNKRIEEHLKEE
ncbi:hypothetical protein ACOJIV_07615 [Haloarcula sp. AONF1]